MILDWSTAYGMVMRAAHVEAGDKIFVHGLSGAVGYAVFTLAKMQGATVYGTASGRKHADLVQAGATPYGYSGKEWIIAMQATHGMDAVFDPLGFESWDESYSILRKGGVLWATVLTCQLCPGLLRGPHFLPLSNCLQGT